MGVVDSLGLVLENEHLTVYIPVTNKAFVFRVKSRYNKGFERINYGPLPLPRGLPLGSYLGGTSMVPVTGVLPAYSYVMIGGEVTFPMSGTYDETDMWYIPKDWRERLFHVILDVYPRWLRIDLTIPKGVVQRRFQRDKITLGIEKNFGFSRGRIETVHFPEIRYGYRFGNDTNLNIYTSAIITYGEYVVEIPKDAEMIFNILTRRYPSHWVTLPVTSYDETIRRGFTETYGIEGFTVYPINKRSEALAEYNKLMKDIVSGV
jgi:hypothetical protein